MRIRWPKQGRGVLVAVLLAFSGFESVAQGPGFPNQPQTKGFVSGPWAPNGGRTAIVAFHQGYLVTQYEEPGARDGSDGIARFFDISNPHSVQEVGQFNAGWNSAINAHGYYQEGNCLRGLSQSDWRFTGSQFLEITDDELCGGVKFHPWTNYIPGRSFQWPGRGMMFQPWHVTPYWSYGNTSYDATLFKGTTLLAEWNPVAETGVIGHPVLLGNLLYYLSENSRTGIAIFDITPSLEHPGTPPRLIGLYREPVNPAEPNRSVGGYWPELWGGGGRLKVLFPDREMGIHVVDVTDPSNIRRELTWRWSNAPDWFANPDPSYVQFQDQYAFTDRFKINMQTLGVEQLFDPTPFGINVTQFSLPLGNLLVTGGIHWSGLGVNSQALAIWAHSADPDTAPPTVGFHVPGNGQTNYHHALPISILIHETLRSETIVNGTAFTVRPVNSSNQLGEPLSGRLVFSFDDVLTFTPGTELDPATTYEVALVQGGMRDAAGNAIARYTFRFSTGDTLIADPNEPSPDPSPPPAPSPNTLDLRLRFSGSPRIPIRVSFNLPTQLRSTLARKPGRPSARVVITFNGEVVKTARLWRQRSASVELSPRRIRSRLQASGSNELIVRVERNGVEVARGSETF